MAVAANEGQAAGTVLHDPERRHINFSKLVGADEALEDCARERSAGLRRGRHRVRRQRWRVGPRTSAA